MYVMCWAVCSHGAMHLNKTDMHRNKYLIFIFVSLTLIVMYANVFCHLPENKVEHEYLNHHDSVKYVGIETCKSCHLDIYQTFIKTGMGKSFDFATKQKSVAQFGKQHIVYDKNLDFYYYPFWQKDSLYIMEFRLQNKDTVYKRTEKIDYIIGSGQHTNSHMQEMNGYFYQLPITWYAQDKKWDLPPGFEAGRNQRFKRLINIECMSCHNAMPVVQPQSDNRFLQVAKGIDCERCHGPGEVHVKEKLAGNIVDTSNQIDYSIVNPRKLSWELQIDLCQRCHLQGNAVLKPGKRFTDFRPGKKLADFVDVYMPKYEGAEDEFIMASHAQRLQMSDCFIKSGKEQATQKLTCITCHNPHVSVQETGKQIFNQACGNCHNLTNDCKEKEELRSISDNNCVGCHMPKSGTIDIPHVTVHDHKIKVPIKIDTKKAINKFVGIYSVNNPQTDNRSKAMSYLSYYEKFEGEKISLDSAKFYASLIENKEEQMAIYIHIFYLLNKPEEIVKIAKNKDENKIADAWLAYRVGQAYQNLGKYFMADKWLKRAILLSPFGFEFVSKLGTNSIMNNKTEEGIVQLEKSLQMNPKQVDVWTNLGFAYMTKRNIMKAKFCYDKALGLDPDFLQALVNYEAMLIYAGRHAEASKFRQRIKTVEKRLFSKERN